MTVENQNFTVEEAYQQYKSMIHHVIHKMTKNVPYTKQRYYSEEMLSISLSLLLPICKGYNPQIAKFSTYLMTSLCRHLNQWRQREGKREKRRSNYVNNATEEDITSREDRNQRIYYSLSEDALYVCDLVCDPPKNMLIFIPESSLKGGMTLAARRDHREAAKEYLRSLGWKLERIKAAFREIQSYFEDRT